MNKHMNASSPMAQHKNHAGYQYPNDQSRIKYLMDSIVHQDNYLISEKMS